jgi:hypothetical protein
MGKTPRKLAPARHGADGNGASEVDLSAQVRALQAERKLHAEAISAIDRVLDQVNRAVAAAKRLLPSGLQHQDRPTSKTRGGMPVARRRNGRFAQTADESILAFIRERGRPTTAEINGHWRREGRKGFSNSVILRLLKGGLIRRVPDPAVRGSRYCAETRNHAAAPIQAPGRKASSR